MDLLKGHLEYSKIEICELSKYSGVSYSSISNLANEKTDINKMQFRTAKLLADALGYSLDQFYLLCTNKDYVFYKNLYGYISFVKGNPKIDIFNLNDEKICEKPLINLKENNKIFLSSLGRYTLEKKVKELEEEKLINKMNERNWKNFS